jgi:pilus assembly protein CpaF
MSLFERIEEVKRRYTPKGPFRTLKEKVHQELIHEFDDELLEGKDEDLKREILHEKITELILRISSEEKISLTRGEHEQMVKEMSDEILGLGPIEPLLHDPSITEIMVNGPNQVYIERKGILELTDIKFDSADHVLHTIQKIVNPLGRRIDESSPYVDARLEDGSRVNAIIPPLSLSGPILTIRKFSKDPYQVDDLIGFGTLTREMADFLAACVRARLNILVSGGTGSGKTTTLNVLSSFISSKERIVTIEDAAELQLHQEHVVRLETRPPNIEGKGEVTTRDLVRNALRMRPDRIIVGEVRGAEALDMLQAMNTGHDGSLTTVHANSPRDALSRVETMTLMAGMDLPMRAIKEQIASAINLVVHQTRLLDGRRIITNITEVQGMEGEAIVLQDIFVFEQMGVDGNGKVIGILRPTGIRPKFYPRFKERGIEIRDDIFRVKDEEGTHREAAKILP